MKRTLAFICFVLGVAYGLSARAENLHQKYGSYWDCGYITAGMPIYNPCKACEDQGMEFFQTSETDGYCVPKEAEPKAQSTPKPPTNKNAQYRVRVCNQSGRGKMFVVLGTHDTLSGVMRFTLRGWYGIDDGACNDLATRPFGRFNEMVFVLHAQAQNHFWPTKVWRHNENWSPEEWIANREAKVNMCVDPINSFEHYTDPPTVCAKENLRAFTIWWVEQEEGVDTVVKELIYR